ncbi:GNAT family N-acetyltransferase [Streptomyces sp. PKU-EA00015]|uniref:GNAT family N-acetyltransferase n=1 Tax=Streptomyces sp. PKU-EA00015 TaxID=2748326 RepID=UPI0015A3206F|nr:GNAT family N-acetyltransferase [Streptomyces sp. PKU-EA00015]NWF28606.1 GNAT family N-acetyltransferase [Streptomyces sp. PKU-EA00015]
MTVIVRDLRADSPEDAEAVTRIRRVVLPFDVTTPESVLFGVRTANPAKRYRLLVAERDGAVIGMSHVGIAYDAAEPSLAYANPVVHPEHRGQGAGGLLLRTAEEHLAGEGARSLFSWVEDTPACRAFAEKRGFRPSRAAHFLRLGLAAGTLPGLPPLPAGVELRTAADYEDDPRPLFHADAEATSDEPSDVGADFTDYDDWIRHTWENPLLDRGLSTVVVVDGGIAAFTAAMTDRETRYLSGMTGTMRAHRGKGFAKLAKTDSLRRARQAGFTDAFTSNDADNGPMLAVNRWFGYEICASEVRHVRTLG